jgi:hypothetical protein
MELLHGKDNRKFQPEDTQTEARNTRFRLFSLFEVTARPNPREPPGDLAEN